MKVRRFLSLIREKKGEKSGKHLISLWRGLSGYIYQLEKETGMDFQTLSRILE